MPGPATIPKREGLLDTPKRVVNAYREFFKGYEEDPVEALSRTFEEVGGYDDIVMLRDIEFNSHCEHHMVPFIGRAHVAYLPSEQVVGISKLARVVEIFARRLQTQETMTAQIAKAIDSALEPRGVAVMIEAVHSACRCAASTSAMSRPSPPSSPASSRPTRLLQARFMELVAQPHRAASRSDAVAVADLATRADRMRAARSRRASTRGLIPVFVADAATGEVLMARLDEPEALAQDLETGEAHYWSRSRNGLWRKGETSGECRAWSKSSPTATRTRCCSGSRSKDAAPPATPATVLLLPLVARRGTEAQLDPETIDDHRLFRPRGGLWGRSRPRPS